jgi:ankyrin repeat protein
MIRMKDFRDDHLWSLFEASASGDLPVVERLAEARPELVNAQYNYTPAIHFAVREGRLEVAQYLIGRGAETVDYRSYPFQDSLLTIAEDREDRAMADLLRELAAQRFPVAPGLASFLDAAKRGDRSAIRVALADDPALARQSDDTGDTALHRAAEIGDLGMMEELIAAGAAVDAARADGHRPVHCALHRGRKTPEQARAAAQFLLHYGAEYTIYLAAAFGDAAYVRAALERDRSQANHTDTQWWRPITAAARRKDFEMVKLLLEYGADPNLPEDGAPMGVALWTAVYLDLPEMVKLLLEHGANPNTSPESSGTAVGHARRNPAVLALLLQYGAKEEARPFEEIDRLIEERRFEALETRLRETGLMSRQEEASWGEGILGGPANAGDLELIEVLVRCGARVPDVTKWGRYYYFKHAKVARYLLEHGMNSNHRSWQEVTLLHDMAHEGSLEKARLLLDHGAEVDAIDGEYRSTPLGFAARWNRCEVALLLIERGADVNRAGADWARPIAWARRKAHTEMAELLHANGAVG